MSALIDQKRQQAQTELKNSTDQLGVLEEQLATLEEHVRAARAEVEWLKQSPWLTGEIAAPAEPEPPAAPKRRGRPPKSAQNASEPAAAPPAEPKTGVGTPEAPSEAPAPAEISEPDKSPSHVPADNTEQRPVPNPFANDPFAPAPSGPDDDWTPFAPED